MMGGMMSGMGNPMEMMQKMFGMGKEEMEKMMGGGFNPWEMCRQMTQAVNKAAEMGSYATPEVRALFEDWVGEVEKEILNFVETMGEVQPKDIAEKLKIKGIVIGDNKER